MTTELPKGIRFRQGRYQARLRHDGRDHVTTWDTEAEAVDWLQRTRAEMMAPAPRPAAPVPTKRPTPIPPSTAPLFGEYAAAYIDGRKLTHRTRLEYLRLLVHFEPLAAHHVDQITRAQVKQWHADIDVPPVEKLRAHELLRAIFNTAVQDEWIDYTPVHVPTRHRR